MSGSGQSNVFLWRLKCCRGAEKCFDSYLRATVVDRQIGYCGRIWICVIVSVWYMWFTSIIEDIRLVGGDVVWFQLLLVITEYNLIVLIKLSTWHNWISEKLKTKHLSSGFEKSYNLGIETFGLEQTKKNCN